MHMVKEKKTSFQLHSKNFNLKQLGTRVYVATVKRVLVTKALKYVCMYRAILECSVILYS